MKELEDYLKICKNTADYIVSQGIRSVVLIDASARIIHLGLNRVLKKDHSSFVRPSFYFVNPEAHILYFNQIGRGFLKGYKLRKQLKRSHPGLMERRKEPTLVMDVCVHSGDTADRVIKGLDRAGFSNIFFGVAQPNDTFYTPDFEAIDYEIGCNPFGRECSVMKGRELCSRISPSRENLLHEALKRKGLSIFLADKGYSL